MMNWYENPEIHAEDYEELLELLRESSEEETEEEWSSSVPEKKVLTTGRIHDIIRHQMKEGKTMWAWAVINEKTGELVEEGIVFKEDAQKIAEEMGEGFIAELMPM